MSHAHQGCRYLLKNTVKNYNIVKYYCNLKQIKSSVMKLKMAQADRSLTQSTSNHIIIYTVQISLLLSI